MRRIAATLVLAAAVCAGLSDTAVAEGGRWEPWTARRIVSRKGTRYAVLQRTEDGKGVRLRLLERKGETPLESRVLPFTDYDKSAELDPPAGDRLLFEGRLDHAPLDVRVLDPGACAGSGLVLFETWGALGSGAVLTRLDDGGKQAWSVDLAGLFEEEVRSTFPKQGRDVMWSRGWFTAGPHHVLVVGNGGHVRRVDLDEGSVEVSRPESLLHPVRDGTEDERIRALDLALELRPGNLRKIADIVLAQENAPLSVQVRASLAREVGGGEKADPALFREATATSHSWPTRVFAVRHLGRVMGKDALPLLRDLVRGEAVATWRPAIAAFADVGEPAVPVLLEMLDEKDRHLDYHGAALLALGELKAESALPRLWKQVAALDEERDENHFLPLSALRAVVAIGPEDLDDRLAKLLADGTPLDGDIALHYRKHPTRAVVPGLIAAMRHRGPYRWERQQLVKALKACTGEDFGNDPDAWRKGLGLDE